MPTQRNRHSLQRSSTFHSTPGTFRFTTFFTGTRLVRTSAQVGFQIECVQQPHVSWEHFSPQ